MAKSIKWFISGVLCLLWIAPECNAAEEKKGSRNDDRSISITIYQNNNSTSGRESPKEMRGTRFGESSNSRGKASILERRKLTLVAGENAVKFLGIPESINPSSVSFKSLTSPENTTILEQSYEHDAINTTSLMEKYIGREVIINRKQQPLKDDRTRTFETIQGKLLAVDEKNFILQSENKQLPIQIIPRDADITEIKLFNLENGMNSSPTLRWIIQSDQAGSHDVVVGYQATSIRWDADYNVVLRDGDQSAEISAWITIHNDSGAIFPKAKLKLVDSNETPFALERLIDIPIGSKQIQMMPATMFRGVEKTFVLDRPSDRSKACNKVDAYISIPNTLKTPLPGGLANVSRAGKNEDDAQIVCENFIESITKDQAMRIKLNQREDIDVARKTQQPVADAATGLNNETSEIRLTNHSATVVKLLVRESIDAGAQWAMAKCTEKYEKTGPNQFQMTVEIPANGEKVITYTIGYNPLQ